MLLNTARIQALARVLGPDNLLLSPQERACYAFDAGCGQGMPEAVALPGDREEVRAIMGLAHQWSLPVTVRGAGSGMTGGAVPVAGGLVLSMARMNRILEIDRDNMVAVAEPGVITAEFQRAVEEAGLFYPPDPASSAFCTLGGNAAECAGGPRGVKYGVTRDYVLGLEAVLASGELIHTGVRTAKGVVGYDLTRLLVGSEGTLAVITRLILRLLPLPEARETFLLLCADLDAAARLVSRLLGAGMVPCTLEFMDQVTLEVVRPRLDDPPPAWCQALLLVELDGQAPEVERAAARLRDFAASWKETRVELRQARDRAEAQALWQSRRVISQAVFDLRPHKVSEDVVVPRSRIPDLVRFTSALGQDLDLVILCFGHAGDGNIHVNIMLDQEDPGQVRAAARAREQIFVRVLELGGTLSGEHGIGTSKSSFLHLELTPPTLELMQGIKDLMDPKGILNPGKIF